PREAPSSRSRTKHHHGAADVLAGARNRAPRRGGEAGLDPLALELPRAEARELHRIALARAGSAGAFRRADDALALDHDAGPRSAAAPHTAPVPLPVAACDIRSGPGGLSVAGAGLP